MFGFTFVNDMRIQQGLIMEILLIAVLILIVVSILGGKTSKATYSWEKKKGAKVLPLVIALILLVCLIIYTFISMFHGAVIRF